MLSNVEVQRAIQSATVAEIAWTEAGRPDVHPVTPLVLAGQPVLALPFAYEDLARVLAASPDAALTLTDTRMTGSSWRSLAITGKPRLVADRDGDVFSAQLLDQELRKYPPSRALADSPLLRREHWWYLPRLLILLDDASSAPLPPRVSPTHQVLAVVSHHRLVVDTVDVASSTGDAAALTLRSLAGDELPEGTAALLGHDFSVPDLERWTPWVTRGHLESGTIRVTDRPSRTTLEPVPGVRQRLRQQRQLEKACRRAIGD
ncbi:pyridoxamine 5'-phosphate oxidase family protein [Phytoactinopolyspora alkaliphila]|uniref:Pyridoxamine 5'-phosphate oxidase family protein n=1 Tax=Phytoactinopolyspora alkaliphila TaxID=1783498 RepID=A0A6N9YLC8_9ACTN|nr:pyridoxamine 5'-phosphate oxidase family protein [Phytoactinopolyspora alkaliphila]NED95794.1 pyridoxamine 5'-phosphate oxidase family protein [Phytoactinopolyspora alkaliphila]